MLRTNSRARTETETSCKTIAIIQVNGGGLEQSGIGGGVEKRSDSQPYIHTYIYMYVYMYIH